uniref:Uncharacterized protein n=1 Tax=Peronospora matthiolae TaxID=2874970 RepID=A0AAV1TDN4_9STRA
MAGATFATTKTPGGVVRPAPGRGSPERVPPMDRAPAVVGVSPARERIEANDDKILAALVGLTERLAKLKSSQRVATKTNGCSALLKVACSLPPLAQTCAVDR